MHSGEPYALLQYLLPPHGYISDILGFVLFILKAIQDMEI